VSDTMIKSRLSDISTLADYYWYEWVKFCDSVQNFPDSQEWLGRYLGPVIYIGPTMDHTVMKDNSEVMYRVSVRSLSLD
jgi:hypothetical protein